MFSDRSKMMTTKISMEMAKKKVPMYFLKIYASIFFIYSLVVTFFSITSRHSAKSPAMMCFLASRTNQR